MKRANLLIISVKSSLTKEAKIFSGNIAGNNPELGKEKIKSDLDAFCQKVGIKTISKSTIGRMIAELKKKNQISKKLKVSLMAKTG